MSAKFFESGYLYYTVKNSIHSQLAEIHTNINQTIEVILLTRKNNYRDLKI